MTAEKRCGRCKQTKPPEVFSKNRSKKDGLQAECRECCNAYYAAYMATNYEKEKARKATYRASGTCADCGRPNDPSYDRCKPCAYANHPGGTNWTTLARDPEWAWSPSNLYLVEIKLERGPVVKVGIGNLRRPRTHKGDILYRIPCPRVVAFYWEQRVLEEAGRDPVDPDQWTGDSGRTEVVESPVAARAIFRSLAEDPWSLAEPNDEILEWLHDYLQGEHLRQLEETS